MKQSFDEGDRTWCKRVIPILRSPILLRPNAGSQKTNCNDDRSFAENSDNDAELLAQRGTTTQTTTKPSSSSSFRNATPSCLPMPL